MTGFVIFCIGLILGSFFNVVIHRVPRGESVVWPPSRCPRCGKRLFWWHNIPVLSFIILRGRCYFCGSKISLRYPLVELLTAFVLLFLWAKLGASKRFLWAVGFFLPLVPAFFIDLEHMILPDVLTLGTLAWGLFSAAAGLSGIKLADGIVGVFVCGGLFLVVLLASKGGLGWGDVKLAASFGVNLGWKLGLLSLFLGVFLGAIFGIVLVLLRKKKRKDKIPFGPFLVIGAFLGFAFGKEILNWYLGLFL